MFICKSITAIEEMFNYPKKPLLAYNRDLKKKDYNELPAMKKKIKGTLKTTNVN